MPRPPKIPGLQQKFESALQKILAKGPLSTGDIQRQLENQRSQFGLADAEVEDLGKNFANYISRAKDADVVRSGGPWAGYQLVRAGGPSPPPPEPGVESVPERPPWRPTEASMHLVATCGLSLQFGARVSSLPTTVDPITWGNADMLMLRGNPSRQRLEASGLDPALFRLADSSPECILTSSELKYGLERNRKPWFQAVAEAAANSRWANESLLIHIPADPQTAPVDEEVVSLARSAEIGIVELSIAPPTDGRRALETRVVSPAPQRPFLRLAELSGNRVGLLQVAHDLLQCWSGDVVTYLHEEGAPRKLLRLLRQALENLKRQAGFTPPQSLKASLARLNGEGRIRDLFGAALDTATTSTASGSDFATALESLDSVMADVSKGEYDVLKADLGALREFATPGSPGAKPD
jgi:hypothetical protein